MRASVYLMTVGSVTFLSNFNNADASTLPESAGRTGREPTAECRGYRRADVPMRKSSTALAYERHALGQIHGFSFPQRQRRVVQRTLVSSAPGLAIVSISFSAEISTFSSENPPALRPCGALVQPRWSRKRCEPAAAPRVGGPVDVAEALQRLLARQHHVQRPAAARHVDGHVALALHVARALCRLPRRWWSEEGSGSSSSSSSSFRVFAVRSGRFRAGGSPVTLLV